MLLLIYLVSQIVRRYSAEKQFMQGAVMFIIKPLKVDEKDDISKYFFDWSPGIPRFVINVYGAVKVVSAVYSSTSFTN